MGESGTGTATFDRRLYAGMSILALGIVLVGFARSYYLKDLFGFPALPVLLHVHGAVMTFWFVLFVTQATLVRARRVDLHRRLGVAGAVAALGVVAIGLATARQFVVRSLGDPELLPFAAAVAGYDAVSLAVFLLLVGAALAWRGRTDIHKRLMTLAALSLLGPPIARLVSDETAVVLSNLVILVPIAIDTLWNRRLHPAYGWGGALVLVSSRAALVLVSSPGWAGFLVPLLR